MEYYLINVLCNFLLLLVIRRFMGDFLLFNSCNRVKREVLMQQCTGYYTELTENREKKQEKYRRHRSWKRVIKNALRGSKGDAQGDDLFFPMYTRMDTHDPVFYAGS